MKALKVNLVQNDAGEDLQLNLRTVQDMLAAAEPADLVVLPEVFALRSSHEAYEAAAEKIPGPQVNALSKLAREHRAWVLGGSIIERDGDRLLNTSVLVDREGKVQTCYRKIHLFEFHMGDKQNVCEADLYSAGDQPVVTDLEGWTAGFSICYDLRFPELYRAYSRQGVNLMFVPSNFTHATGQAHWEILLRARAIENQCFVLAPNQCGANPSNGIVSYGHSMVVAPWGEMVVEGGETPAVWHAELNPRQLNEAEERVPALKHRVL